MNPLILLISLLLFFAKHSGKETKSDSLALKKDKDFFSENRYIQASWLGYLKSHKTKKIISYLPMFIYENNSEGYGKIICVPKSPGSWSAKFAGKQIAEKKTIGKTISRGILNNSLGKNDFRIYSFFFPKQDVAYSTANSKNYIPKFPCVVYIYKKHGIKWNIMTQKSLKNITEFQDLQYQTARFSGSAN